MRIGESFNNVGFDKLIDLLKETHNRVYLDISDVDTAEMFLKSCDHNIDYEAIEQLIGVWGGLFEKLIDSYL